MVHQFFIENTHTNMHPNKEIFIYWIMSKYFKRLRHEYINKYYDYMEKINFILASQNI